MSVLKNLFSDTGYIVSAASTAFSFGRSTRPTHISSTFCDGSELGLLNCFHYKQSCHYAYDAGVSCEGQPSLILLCVHNTANIIGASLSEPHTCD